MFYQLWTIHALVRNAVLPMVYVFLTRKTEQTYNRVLDVLTSNRVLSPSVIITDFERAAMNSFQVLPY